MKAKQAYDGYGEFDGDLYFVNRYNVLPSTVVFNISLEVNKQNFDQLMELLDLDSKGLKLVLKKWKTSNEKDAKQEDDHITNCFYASDLSNLCMGLNFDCDELSLVYLYESGDEATEKWALSVVKNLRNKFAKAKTPVFSVLGRNNGRFYTDNVKIDKFATDILKNYNDDFSEIDKIIEDSLEKKESGLILLHGKPGTGKTSYIKHLLCRKPDQQFIFIPVDFVNALLQPDFISFLIHQKNSVLIIEDAEKVIMSRDDAGQNSVVSTILQLTDGLFSDYLNIKVICTFNTDVSKIDKALFRKGRMIAFYEFRELDENKTKELLNAFGDELPEKALTLAEIYNYQKKDFNTSSRKKIGF